MSVVTAAAAPGNTATGPGAMYQATVDADVCIALYDVGILTAAGDLVTAGLDAAALVDAALTEGVTIDADVALLILAGGCAGQIPAPAPANGTLTVVVTDEGGGPLAGATVAFANGDGGTTGADGSFTTTTAYVPGDYAFTASLDGYQAVDGVVSVTDGPAAATVALPLADPGPANGTLTVVVTDGDGTPLAGATVDIDGAESGVTGADGSFTTAAEYAPGEYSFTASLDGYEPVFGVVTVSSGDAATTVALSPVVAPGLGTVEVINFYCPSVTTTEFDGAVADDCLTGGATFTFYLIGDGTDANQQLTVYEDGYGMIDLAAGDYVVVHEGTQAEATITVTAGEITTLVVESPGEAPAPRNGTVTASAFLCDNIDTVSFTSDAFAAAQLPVGEAACEPTTATFTFYLVGDGTNDFQQLVVNGSASIELAPGTYEVVEEGTQARVFIDVFAGDFVTLSVSIPSGANIPGTSVNVVKYYCDTVTETEFLFHDDGMYDREELPGAPDCTPGNATFTFYLVGDGTNDFAQLAVVGGAGSIGLLPGTYEVVEEGTLATTTITVEDGENTLLIVNNPMPEDGEVPGTPEEPAAPGDGTTTPGSKSGGTTATSLPSTGSGEAADGQAWMLLAGAALVSAVGFQITRRQTNS